MPLEKLIEVKKLTFFSLKLVIVTAKQKEFILNKSGVVSLVDSIGVKNNNKKTNKHAKTRSGINSKHGREYVLKLILLLFFKLKMRSM